jgi:4-amino-4-deoxy-L-arabinose transferase-like glycosyltransferase
MPQVKEAKILLYFVIGFFLCRMLSLFFISEIIPFEVDEIAQNILRFGEMKYVQLNKENYNYQFPVYPSLLFLFYKVFGVFPKVAIVLNCLLHSLAVMCSFSVFKWFAEKCSVKTIQTNVNLISLLSSLAFLFHPLINYYSLMIIHPFSLDVCLMMFALYFMTKYFKDPTRKKLILLGIIIGVAVLDRASFIVLLFPFLVEYNSKNSFLSALKKTSVLVGICLLVLMPWVVRNYFIYDRVSINSSVGQNLWLGIQEATDGSAYTADGVDYEILLSESDWQNLSKCGPLEQSDYFLNKYKEEVKKNPAHAIKMYFIKLKNFWWFRNGIGTEYGEKIRNLVPLYKVTFILILILSVFFVFKCKKETFVLLSFLIVLSLFQAIFYVENRHRVLIEPLLIFMAIGGGFIFVKGMQQKLNN